MSAASTPSAAPSEVGDETGQTSLGLDHRPMLVPSVDGRIVLMGANNSNLFEALVAETKADLLKFMLGTFVAHAGLMLGAMKYLR